MSWRGVTIDQISPTDGSLLSVAYSLPSLEAVAAAGVPYLGSLATDPSGRYVIMHGIAPSHYPAYPIYGWIGQGTLHALPYPSAPYAKTGFWGDGPVAW